MAVNEILNFNGHNFIAKWVYYSKFWPASCNGGCMIPLSSSLALHSWALQFMVGSVWCLLSAGSQPMVRYKAKNPTT